MNMIGISLNIIVSQIAIFTFASYLGNSLKFLREKSPVHKNFFGYIIILISFYIFVLAFPLQLNFFFIFINLSLLFFVVYSALFTRLVLTSRYLSIGKLVSVVTIVLINLSNINAISNQSIYNINSELLSYWHSSNNDIFDALCGAKAILGLETLNFNHDSRIESETIIPFSSNWVCLDKSSEYLGSLGALQYTTTAFLSLGTNLYPSMLNYLLICIIFGTYFFYNLKLFYSKFLNCRESLSISLSLITIFSHLYFVTFINGHIGTQMIAPVLVLLLQWVTNTKAFHRKHIYEICLLLFFSFLTYPYVIPLIAIFAYIYFYLDASIKQKLVSTLLIIVLIVLGYFFAEDMRIKALTNFRAWGSIATWLLPLHYLGIVPGNINGVGLLGRFQEFILAIGVFPSIIPIISTLLTVLCFSLITRHLLTKRDLALNAYALAIIVIPLLIFFFTLDSYFLYKTLYIFQFVFIAIIASLYLELRIYFLSKHSRFALNSIFCLVIFLNIFWNLVTAHEIFKINLKQTNLAESLLKLDVQELRKSITLEPEASQSLISGYLLSYVRENETLNYGQQLNALKVKKADGKFEYYLELLPKDFLFIQSNLVSQAEKSKDGVFRWVSAYPFVNGKPSHNAIKIDVINQSGNGFKSGICLKLADFSNLDVLPFQIKNEEGLELFSGSLYRQAKCFDFNIPANSAFITMNFFGTGVRPSFFDGRRLLFQILEPRAGSNFVFS